MEISGYPRALQSPLGLNRHGALYRIFHCIRRVFGFPTSALTGAKSYLPFHTAVRRSKNAKTALARGS